MDRLLGRGIDLLRASIPVGNALPDDRFPQPPTLPPYRPSPLDPDAMPPSPSPSSPTLAGTEAQSATRGQQHPHSSGKRRVDVRDLSREELSELAMRLQSRMRRLETKVSELRATAATQGQLIEQLELGLRVAAGVSSYKELMDTEGRLDRTQLARALARRRHDADIEASSLKAAHSAQIRALGEELDRTKAALHRAERRLTEYETTGAAHPTSSELLVSSTADESIQRSPPSGSIQSAEQDAAQAVEAALRRCAELEARLSEAEASAARAAAQVSEAAVRTNEHQPTAGFPPVEASTTSHGNHADLGPDYVAPLSDDSDGGQDSEFAGRSHGPSTAGAGGAHERRRGGGSRTAATRIAREEAATAIAEAERLAEELSVTRRELHAVTRDRDALRAAAAEALARGQRVTDPSGARPSAGTGGPSSSLASSSSSSSSSPISAVISAPATTSVALSAGRAAPPTLSALSVAEARAHEAAEEVGRLSAQLAEMQTRSSRARVLLEERDREIADLRRMLRERDHAATAAARGTSPAMTSLSAASFAAVDGKAALADAVADMRVRLVRAEQAEAALRDELRELESRHGRAGVSMDYLKNVVVQFLGLPTDSPERRSLLPVLRTLLRLDDDDLAIIAGRARIDNPTLGATLFGANVGANGAARQVRAPPPPAPALAGGSAHPVTTATPSSSMIQVFQDLLSPPRATA